MTGKDPLPALPRGCMLGCGAILAGVALLLAGGFALGGNAAVAILWAMMLFEALRTGEVAAIGDWGLLRETRPVGYWTAIALLLALFAFSIYQLASNLLARLS